MDRSKERVATLRKARAARIRKKIKGTQDRPRLCVIKSNKHIAVQLIDDEQGHTVFGISTYAKSMDNPQMRKKSKESARYLGSLIAKEALKQEISKMVVDRGAHGYYGLLEELVNAIRKEGIWL